GAWAREPDAARAQAPSARGHGGGPGVEVDAAPGGGPPPLPALRAAQPGDAAGARAPVEHARGPPLQAAQRVPQFLPENAVAAEVCVGAFHLSKSPNAD